MATKKNFLGKVLKDLNGYKIRQMGTNKTIKNGRNESNLFQPNGNLGVYAGKKKLVKDGFKSIDSAVEYISTL